MKPATDIHAALAAASPEVVAKLNGYQLSVLHSLVTSLVEPGSDRPDPLEDVLASMSARAKMAGITDADVEAELAAYNVESRT